jgi:hemolysin III
MLKKRKQTIGEEIANAISHGVMAIFGIFILIMLILRSHSSQQLMGAIIYGISVTLLYLFSCLYHALGNNNAK